MALDVILSTIWKKKNLQKSKFEKISHVTILGALRTQQIIFLSRECLKLIIIIYYFQIKIKQQNFLRSFFWNFESEWPKIDSSKLRSPEVNSCSLNSVGSSRTSSGSIWRNQSEQSFSNFTPVGSSASFIDESIWDGGLTLGGQPTSFESNFGAPFMLGGEGLNFDPWEETRLPVFRHLSRHDAEKA